MCSRQRSSVAVFVFMLALLCGKSLGAEADLASADASLGAVQRVCPTTQEVGIDYQNCNDLERVDAQNVGECCAACAAFQACRAYSYNSESLSCYLKSGRCGAVASDALVSGYFEVTPAPTCSSTQVQNYDFFGDDIAEHTAATHDACCSLCGGYDGCFAYTYHPDSQRCYLKKGRGAITAAPGIVSGYFATPQHQCTAILENNIDYHGDDIGEWPTPDYTACCNLCQDYDLCTHWSHGEGTCWMKNGKGRYEPNNNRISGHYAQSDSTMVADQFRDYTGTQGSNGWYYLYKLTPTDTPLQAVYQTCQTEANTWCWRSDAWGQMTRTYMHIGATNDCGSNNYVQTIRRWVASTSGSYTFTITWQVAMFNGLTQTLGFDLNGALQWQKIVGVDQGVANFQLDLKTGDYVQYWAQPLNGCHGASVFSNFTVYLHNQMSNGQRFCADSVAENQYMDLHCDTGVINRIVFASYGDTADRCPTLNPTIGPCHSETAYPYVQQNCLGFQSCHLNAHNDVFGDPCVGVAKHLMVVAECGPGNGTHNYVTTGFPPFVLTANLNTGNTPSSSSGSQVDNNNNNSGSSSTGWIVAVVVIILVAVIAGLGYVVWRMRKQLKPIRQGFGVLDLSDDNDDESTSYSSSGR